MSGSVATSSIYMTDSTQQVADKVKKYAFSGGRETKEEHQRLGGNLEVDVPYQYLSVFEFDDEKLKDVGEKFKSGKMLSGEIKQVLVDVLLPIIEKHKEERAKVTDEMVEEFMRVRPLEFRGVKEIRIMN